MYLSGGEIVGQGGNGCVLSTEKKDIVEKIGSDKNIKEEFDLSQALLVIDPKQKYGIYAEPPLTCMNPTHFKLLFKGSNVKKEGKCKTILDGIQSNSKQFCSYQMKRFVCDIRIENFYKLDLSTKDYFRNWYNLWSGLELFHKNNIVHSDIKPENIAYKTDRTFVYFDWGWSRNITKDTEALSQLKNMRYTEFRYMPLMFKNELDEDYEIDGIWSPLIYDAKSRFLVKSPELTPKIARGIKALLKFNDVYSLSLAQFDITNYLIDEIQIIETDDIKKLQSLFESILNGSKDLNLMNFRDNTAEALIKSIKNELYKILQSV
jgi:serine/threonine protein kinase